MAKDGRRGLPLAAAAALATAVGSSLVPAPARAGQQPSESLLQQSTMVVNQQSNVYSFNTPGAGTLTVQLSDVVWPVPLQDLYFSLNSPQSVLGWLATQGSLTLQVSQAGTYYADVTGTAAAGLDLGLYTLQVSFQPQGSTVPLPAALGLLLAGLGILVVVRRMRNESVMCDV